MNMPTLGPRTKRAHSRLDRNRPFYLKVGTTTYYVDCGGWVSVQNAEGAWKYTSPVQHARHLIQPLPARR